MTELLIFIVALSLGFGRKLLLFIYDSCCSYSCVADRKECCCGLVNHESTSMRKQNGTPSEVVDNTPPCHYVEGGLI